MVIESSEMISAPIRSASAIPTAVLPTAVAPVKNQQSWKVVVILVEDESGYGGRCPPYAARLLHGTVKIRLVPRILLYSDDGLERQPDCEFSDAEIGRASCRERV